MSNTTSGRLIGTLILIGYIWGVGNALVNSVWADPGGLTHAANHQTQISVGVTLMLLDSVAVASIGLLMVGVLKRRHPTHAVAYLVGRVLEAGFLAVGALFLLLLIPISNEYAGGEAERAALESLATVVHSANHYAAQLAWISLGTASLMLCRALWQQRLVPRWLAAWGALGYAIFVTGALLEIFGYHLGVALSVPGGLFEITLAVLLIWRGFPNPPKADASQLSPNSVLATQR